MITVKEGQTLYDIALQHAGSLSAIISIAETNNISLDQELLRNQLLKIPSVINSQLVNYYKTNNITIATR